MVRVFTSTMALLCVLGSVGNLMAQDLNAMNNAFNQQMNARMNQQLSGIIQTNMQDPRVQQMYRMHRAQGGTLDFPSYCYQYARTAGFTREGVQNAVNSDRAIERREQDHMNQYRAWSNNLQRETTDYRTSAHDRWARQRGENLSGTGTYGAGNGGPNWTLPHTTPVGGTIHDANTGNTFHASSHGGYWVQTPNGSWMPIYRQ